MQKIVPLKDFLLITPPFTQLNTPYPGTAYVKGFLNTKGISSYQIDLGLEVILKLFSKNGLTRVFDKAFAFAATEEISDNSKRILSLRSKYIQTIDGVISFLKGKDLTLSRLICQGGFLPEAGRFAAIDDLDWAFGTMGMQDKAKHLATLYLEDLSDLIVECVDENFGFSRYAERMGRSANSFDAMYQFLQHQPSFIDSITLDILELQIQEQQPLIIGFSVPFPGNLYSAFRCAQYIKKHHPNIVVVMGGGFPNTELRSLKEPRVFEFFDFITLDDGELPTELLFDYIKQGSGPLKRTFLLEDGNVVYKNDSERSDYKMSQTGTPDYSDLLLSEYISVIEVANPMHSLWSDGRWNKLTMAHGCYWGKCTFCDISLDYIKIYEPVTARLIVDRMEEIIAATGTTGFHFVDEAAPPALMREVALEIIRRQLTVTWWTNIRFEKSFTAALCKLLKASGCIAVSGGLEVASDRLLELIKKGVTVEQVAQVTHHLSEAGIMVHAYLMYGYPTQTVQETIDSLEMVRQLFELGIVHSGFWHQFAMTAHSPVGISPELYGVVPKVERVEFAHNDIEFTDKTGIDHDKFSFGLKKSLFNFMHGICFDYPLQEWFDFKIPQSKIAPSFIEDALQKTVDFTVKPNAKLVWMGSDPELVAFIKNKKGRSYELAKMTFHEVMDFVEVQMEMDLASWLQHQLIEMRLAAGKPLMTLGAFQKAYELQFEDFELFWFSKPMEKIKAHGLLIL